MRIGDKQRAGFEARYIKTENGCWQWAGSLFDGGYGHFSFRQKPRAAHRFSYELYIGDIPQGLCIMHTCDNPGCVNPAHLRLGTHAHNMQDKVKKGHARTSTIVELTDREKIEILNLHKTGKSCRSIGRVYGISTSRVTGIINSKRLQALAAVV